MDLTPNTKKKWFRWTISLILICILIFLGVKNVDTVSKILLWCLRLALPLLMGIAIALIIDVPMQFFESILWKNTTRRFWIALRRPTSFFLSILLIIGGLVGIIMIIIPEIIESIKIIATGAVDLITRVDAMTDAELEELPFGNIINAIDWHKMLESMQTWIKAQSSAIVKGAFLTLGSVVTAIFDLVVSFAFGIYLLFSKDKLKRQLSRAVRVWLPKDFGNWLMHACSVTSKNFHSFISGQTLEALILGVLCMLGMLIFNIPYAPMVSVLVGITALIPVIGGFIGGGIGAFMILTSDPSKALFFVIFLVILQQLEGNLIYPKVMGHRIHLPGIWILAAVTLGGGIGGPIGMLLSVPITSTAYVLVKEATAKREKELEEKKSEEGEDYVEYISELFEGESHVEAQVSELTKENATESSTSARVKTKSPQKGKESSAKKRTK